jgi:hypothetical protein
MESRCCRYIYFKEIVANLSKELKTQYGRGYSQRNIFSMIKLYDLFPDENILQTLSAKLIWLYYISLMKIEDMLKMKEIREKNHQ